MRAANSGRFSVAVPVLVVTVLLLAAGLRLSWSGIVEFKRDEANLSLLALDLASGRDVPLLGIGSSVSFPNAPINVYLLAIPYLLGSNPLFATWFIALLNVIAVALVYRLGDRIGGRWVGSVAALLYAVSPWAVMFSRKIWAQNMLPPFTVLLIWAGIAGFIDGKRWGQWLFVPLLVIVGQIHYGAFVLIPAAIYLFWNGRKRLTRAFWLSLIPAVLLLLPYLIGLSRADLLSPSRILDAVEANAEADTRDESLISLDAFDGAQIMIAGTDLHALAGPDEFLNYLDRAPDAYPLFRVVAWAVAAGCLWLLVRAVWYRDARAPLDIALLLWLVFPVVAFSFTWTPFYIHYLIPILPAAFIVLGLAIFDIWKALARQPDLRRIGAFATGVILAVIMVLQIGMFAALLDFVDSTATPGGFGTPLHYLQPARADALAAGQPILADLDGQAVGFDGDATVWQALLYDAPFVRFTDAMTDVYPAEASLRLTAACEPATIDAHVYPLRPGEGCYQLVERAPDALDVAAFDSVTGDLRRFANGVELNGYAWERGGNACLSLLWSISQTASIDTMFAVHFYDADGERVYIADGLSWQGRYWQAGDRAVRRFCVGDDALPPVETVQIGMYVLAGSGFSNVDVLDAAGNRAGQMIVLPLDDS